MPARAGSSVIRGFGAAALRLGVTVGVLAYVGSGIDLDGVVRVVARVDGGTWGLLLITTAADRALAVGRWLVLVRAADIDLPVRSGVRLFLVSSFLGSFLPAGIGGDVARTWELASRTGRPGAALGIAALDRWLGIACVLGLGALGVAFGGNLPIDSRIKVVVYTGFAGVLVAGVAAGLAERLAGVLLPTRWATPVARAAAALRQIRRRPAIGLAVGLSFATQLLRIVVAWLVGLGMSMDVPLTYYFAVMPVAIALILLPISMGGFGPAQGAMVWMLRPAGVAGESSLAMSTVYISLGLIGNLPGGLLFLWPRSGSRSRYGGDGGG